MPLIERVEIIKNLSMVDSVCPVIDDDKVDDAGGAIFHTLSTHASDVEIIVANGGDRKNGNIPEEDEWGGHPRVSFVYGVGGEDKKNSSSWILKEWSQPTTARAWGKYTVLDKGNGWATKKLTFDIGKSLSDQRHFKRSEHWHVVEGTIQMSLEYANGDTETKTYTSGESIDIPANAWHKATNVGNTTAEVIEVWLGNHLSEEDIERRD